MRAAPPIRVLFFCNRPIPMHLAWQGTLAHALQLRGADCRFFACDGLLRDACNLGYFPALRPEVCRICSLSSRRFFDSLGFPTQWLSEFAGPMQWEAARQIVDAEPLDELPKFTYRGLPLGEMAKVSVAYFLRTEDFSKEPATLTTYRQFLIGGVLIADVCERLLDMHQPDVVELQSGQFLTDAVMFHLARSRGIRVITHETGYADDTILFNMNAATNYDPGEVWKGYAEFPLSSEENEKLDAFTNRWQSGKEGLVRYQIGWRDEEDLVHGTLGLQPGRRFALLLPNVNWDSSLLGLNGPFPSMAAWVQESIRYFSGRSDVDLVIRAHPGETVLPGGTRQRIQDIITSTFPSLPPNIRVVPSESTISTYALMRMATVGLVYVSTTGLELALSGKRVVVSGLAHYRGRGFSWDPMSPAEYTCMLEQLLDSDRDPSEVGRIKELARRYAYLFFFRTMVPFRYVNTGEHDDLPWLKFQGVDDLAPGRDPHLDRICAAFLTGSSFIAPPAAASRTETL